MAILPIVQLSPENLFCPASCLRKEADDVLLEELTTEWFRKLVFDMLHTLYNSPSGIGLSANQIGIMKKISIIDRDRDGKHPLILLNPSYEATNSAMLEGPEACMSFPGISATVKRHESIRVSYMDVSGIAQSMDISGKKSIVFQHEIDHLYGITHVDIATNKSDIGIYEGRAFYLSQKSESLIFGEK